VQSPFTKRLQSLHFTIIPHLLITTVWPTAPYGFQFVVASQFLVVASAFEFAVWHLMNTLFTASHGVGSPHSGHRLRVSEL